MALKGRHPRESETVMAELMMPQHANVMGNVFGGVVLSLVDRVAAVCAIRHSSRPCVTVSVDKVDFKEPIHVSELITAYARVNFAGRTSMEVGVKPHQFVLRDLRGSGRQRRAHARAADHPRDGRREAAVRPGGATASVPGDGSEV